jgi:ABC-type dipeptide/oligopeptide/nickel transport system permease component
MAAFLARRLTDLVITILGVSTLAFVVLRMSGDPVDMLLPPEASQEMVAEVRRSLGLDAPLYVQYVRFLGGAFSGDFGNSLQYRKPAVEMIRQALPATIQLAVVSMVITVLIAVPAGIFAALKRNTFVDRFVLIATTIGQSMPFFWLGIMMILFFAVKLGWLPTSGSGTPAHLILPSLTLAAYAVSQIARLVRSSMLDVLGHDYVRTARAKGLRERTVILRHVLKNAAIPVVTVLGIHFGILMGGTVVTETIFAWPGLGRLIISSIALRDYPVVQAGVVYLAIIFVLINSLLDISYGFLDPTIRQR